MDLDLLKLVEKKEQYLRFKPFINDTVLSDEAKTIYNNVAEYYRYFPVTEIDWSAFETFFLGLKRSAKKDELEVYKRILSKIKTHTTTAVAEEVIRHYITLDYATKIGSVALDITTGSSSASMDDIAELCKKHDKELGRAVNKSDLFVTSVSSAVKSALAPGLEWRLEELNLSLGPLRQGDFIIVAARVETGKTTFIADQIGYMGQQLPANRPVVWVNNEEQSDKVLLRVMQAQLGMTAADIVADEPAAVGKYESLMHGKGGVLVLKNDAGLHNVSQLNTLFAEINPGLIVFDQLDKISGFHSRDEGEHVRLGKLYKWARDLAHEYGPVVAISQADASAENQKWIGMDQLRGSKTDKPGEADAIITIGRTDDPGCELKRYINIPKNKLFGGPRTDSDKRHYKWEVELKPDIARYKGSY